MFPFLSTSIHLDSVFFIHREGEYLPKTGDFLGDFTNEISPNDGYLVAQRIIHIKQILVKQIVW
jgi:hypothetical protein